MSSKRKLRRAQAQHAATPAAQPNRDSVRMQTATQRFSKAGSEKLWIGLLGWPEQRIDRAWLAQSVHDGARSASGDANAAARVCADFAARVSSTSEMLDERTAAHAVDVWRSSGDDYLRGEPAPKWHFLVNLADKLGLGATTPEQFQDDWEAWTSLTLAAGPRAALMASLGQAEQAAVMLHSLTQSERMGALVNISRAMWTALAYGDAASFELLESTSRAWLQTVGRGARPPE